jgi:hypothetical protein
MSRSTRNTPAGGMTTSVTEKQDKRKANRKFRKAEKQALLQGKEPPTNKNEISNVWEFAKDGKGWWGDCLKEWPDYFKKLMRK